MDELVGVTKMLCALVEHSSEWLVTRISQPDVQAFFGTVLRLTGWSGTAGVDEEVSEVSSSASELT
jgi:hypothetical protein